MFNHAQWKFTCGRFSFDRTEEQLDLESRLGESEARADELEARLAAADRELEEARSDMLQMTKNAEGDRSSEGHRVRADEAEARRAESEEMVGNLQEKLSQAEEQAREEEAAKEELSRRHAEQMDEIRRECQTRVAADAEEARARWAESEEIVGKLQTRLAEVEDAAKAAATAAEDQHKDQVEKMRQEYQGKLSDMEEALARRTEAVKMVGELQAKLSDAEKLSKEEETERSVQAKQHQDQIEKIHREYDSKLSHLEEVQSKWAESEEALGKLRAQLSEAEKQSKEWELAKGRMAMEHRDKVEEIHGQYQGSLSDLAARMEEQEARRKRLEKELEAAKAALGASEQDKSINR